MTDLTTLETATAAINDMRTAHEAYRTSSDARFAAMLADRDNRIAALEVRANRPGAPLNVRDPAVELYTRAYDGFLRRGVDSLPLELRTVMTTATTGGPDAGYLIPPEFFAELDRNLVQFSPMRTVSRVMQASTAAVILPKRTAIMAASWEPETTAEPVANSTYGSFTLNIFTMKTYVDVSMQLLEDAAFPVAAEVANDLGEAFGKLEGSSFLVGTGTTQPLGVTAATITTSTVAATTGPTADELIAFFMSLPSPYAKNATWLMNRNTIGYIRQMATSAGLYLWQGPTGPLSIGVPGELLGRPIVEMPDMPDIAASAIPIAFGDFKSGHRIVDRVGMTVLRDPFSQATNSNIRFHGRRRVGGEVTKAEAIRLLACAAS